MNFPAVQPEEKSVVARRLCEQAAWDDVVAFAETWQREIPNDHRAFYYLALGLSGRGQFVQAETAYRRALELNPTDPKVWSNLGALLYEHLQRSLDGIRCVEQALKLDPAHKLGWSNLASMAGQPGHHDKAIHFADRALALDNQFIEAYLHKGTAALALGKKEIVREVCNALGTIPPEKFCRPR